MFLGGLGAGRFYLGYAAIGATQLILNVVGLLLVVVALLPGVVFEFPRVWVFAPGVLILIGLGVWVVIEAIVIFAGGIADADGRSLR